MVKGKLILTFYDEETPTILRGAANYSFDVSGYSENETEKASSEISKEILDLMNYLESTGNLTLFPKENKQSLVSENIHNLFSLIPMIKDNLNLRMEWAEK